MIIDCIADLHGHYPELEGGDLLIVAGDLTARDTIPEYMHFAVWLCKQKYKKKIVISGNHDNVLENGYLYAQGYTFKTIDGEGFNFDYLCDSGTEFEGLKIWGSPWTKTFEGMNPKCKAFTVDTEEELAVKFSLIPEDTDILITHSPSHGILDEITHNYYSGMIGNLKYTPKKENVGSKSLYGYLKYTFRPYLHVFGHIHEGYGQKEIFACRDNKYMKSINASLVNEHYQPVNKPIRIML